MLRFIFPPKKHPEDIHRAVAWLARAVLLFGLCGLFWSGYQLTRWVRSLDFESTVGRVSHTSMPGLRASVSHISFSYEIAGNHYTSQEIAVGGRSLGQVPPEGPVTVYFDPAAPENAVLKRQPDETVWLALVIGLLSPWIAGFLWRNYA